MPVGSVEIQHRWGYHPATSKTAPLHEKVREAYMALAEYLDGILPDGRAKSSAFTKLQESSMWANYGVAELAPVAVVVPVAPVTAKPTPPASSKS